MQESIPHVIKYELRFDRLEEAVSRFQSNSLENHLDLATCSVWDAFETFQFYLDKKEEVERMTLEDFVTSVVSHAEVSLWLRRLG